ncbi:hypothetical protein [Hyphomicrobium sp. NDB2Meth4]|uniref:hypothetical protein n=1 Tax=Hyphomicrobium sp. NDB2Meth4 TaxID=1892846 RepID=UPI0009303ACA|nr:hypothetical protein [Hyphomicrobium sp. NDB2Meth4]
MDVVISIAVPISVVVLYYFWRKFLGIEYESGTDLIAVLLSFDLVYLMGALPSLENVALPHFKHVIFPYFVGLAVFMLLLSYASLRLELHLKLNPSEASRSFFSRSRFVRVASYAPAFMAVAAHVPPFYDIVSL